MIQFDQLEGELSLKAIAWDFDQNKFVSPSRKQFVWRDDGLESAECVKGCKDEDIPGDNCTCGLYSTFRWNIIQKGYTKESLISPVLLVEAVGKTQLHDDGTRSYQQAMRAVIATWGDRLIESVTGEPIRLVWGEYAEARMRGAAHQAADYFHVPVLDMEVATVVMDLWNIHLNAMWGFENEGEFGYIPESQTIKKMKPGEVEILSQQYLPAKPKGVPVEEVTWETLLRSG